MLKNILIGVAGIILLLIYIGCLLLINWWWAQLLF
nr:MAG TPA: hypothetical protein [Caudoviricetes sp.]